MRVVVVGAGAGGLACAARAASCKGVGGAGGVTTKLVGTSTPS